MTIRRREFASRGDYRKRPPGERCVNSRRASWARMKVFLDSGKIITTIPLPMFSLLRNPRSAAPSFVERPVAHYAQRDALAVRRLPA